MNGCIYKQADGKCKQFSVGGVLSFCVEGPCDCQIQSNADKIRSMSDEELAEWLTMIEKRVIENALSKPFKYTDDQLKADWLDWLKQEVDE